jgi:predicted nucleic acid-binding protein
MTAPILLDTGPLVAGLDRRDQHHAWAIGQITRRRGPFFTCESVLSEACFLLRRVRDGTAAVMDLVDKGAVAIAFRFSEEAGAVAELLTRYADLPMSFADACLVRMAEQHSRSAVLTLDSDFKIYRKNRSQTIPLITPT